MNHSFLGTKKILRSFQKLICKCRVKILYITRGDHIDYQNDCLLIGLKEFFGTEVVDINKQHHLYDSYPPDYTRFLYGKGFSISRTLPDLPVDRTDILSKIRNKFFDFIIYGSIWRSPGSRDDLPEYPLRMPFNNYLLESLEYYPKNRIIAVDGNDFEPIHPIYDLGIVYFKREIYSNNKNLFPISFAMPTCKVNFNKNKTRNHSYITPEDTSTYIYDRESDYYEDYNQSRFGVTIKKSGWDCLRHYEILSNGCIPNFKDIFDCPDKTLTLFPKELCKKVLIDLRIEKEEIVYDKYIEKFESHFYQNNTTESLARYFIDKIKSIS